MWGPWGSSMWGGWWIVPVIGMAVCLGFMVLMMWTMLRGGGGCGCMSGHRGGGGDGRADLRREISELRDEVRQLGARVRP